MDTPSHRLERIPPRAVLLLIAALVLTAVATAAAPRRPRRAGDAVRSVLPEPLVEQGSEEEAKDYYRTIATDLGFSNPESFVDNHTLQQLLTFCGYEKLLAKDLQNLDSADVMDFDRLKTKVTNVADFTAAFGAAPAAGDGIRTILSSRFFAPKIVDVSDVDVPAANNNLGWRHVVRLKVRAGSPAELKGLDSLWILFNHFAKAGTSNPFLAESSNNQAMLIRKTVPTGARPVYWFVYGALSGTPPGKLQLFLPASFDASDPAGPPPDPIKKYFVPVACAQCHGGNELDPSFIFSTAKLNFLDTDHWFDRVQPGDDFERLTSGDRGVLFDAGKTMETGFKEAFEKAFGVIRNLNGEIRDQIEVVEPNLAPIQKPSFQLRAVTKWLDLHKTDVSHRPRVDRALEPRVAGEAVWTSSQSDQDLLCLLNRYCYRCHSSFSYHVFDKQMVKNRATRIKNFVNTGFMPQDRTLAAGMAGVEPPSCVATKLKIIELVDKLTAP